MTASSGPIDITQSGIGATFVYRGQLHVELSRIRFLLAATCEAFEHVDIVLLSPGLGASASDFEQFGRQFSSVRNISFVSAGRLSTAKVRHELRGLIAPDAPALIGIGFSVGAYLPKRSCVAWCVNGIPEERLLHGTTARNHFAAWIDWRSARRTRAARTIVVSEPMAKLIRRRTEGTPVVVPNTVDRSQFYNDSSIDPTYLTYQGSGAPWQGLDRLALVWQELHRLDPALRFRVITQDERAKRLAEGLPAEVIEVRSTGDSSEVAAMLREARLGFLFRAPNIVNEVSWPMKLGEYLGAGSPVVVSRCGWDAERLIERFDAGLVVNWSDPPALTAASIADYLGTIGNSRPPLIDAAAELDDERWTPFLREVLTEAVQAAFCKGGSNER